jgi:hypothetical protein
MSGTSGMGRDLIVWLDGKEETPKEYKMLHKMTVPDLNREFGKGLPDGKARVYLGNTNLQSLPRLSIGAVVWLKKQQVIGVTMRSRGSSGEHALEVGT